MLREHRHERRGKVGARGFERDGRRADVGAVERAEKELGASIEVVDLLTLSPCDFDTVVESVGKTGRCVVVHEAVKTGGMGAEIVARVNERCFWSLRAPPERVTSWDVPYPLYAREKAFLPDQDRIVAAIRRTLEAE